MSNIFFDDFTNDTLASLRQRYPGATNFAGAYMPDLPGLPISTNPDTTYRYVTILPKVLPVLNVDRREVLIEFDDDGLAGPTLSAVYYFFGIGLSGNSNQLSIRLDDGTTNGAPNFPITKDVSLATVGIVGHEIRRLYIDVNRALRRCSVNINGIDVILDEDFPDPKPVSFGTRYPGFTAHFIPNERRSPWPDRLKSIVVIDNNPDDVKMDIESFRLHESTLTVTNSEGFYYTEADLNTVLANVEPSEQKEPTIVAEAAGTLNLAIDAQPDMLAHSTYLAGIDEVGNVLELNGVQVKGHGTTTALPTTYTVLPVIQSTGNSLNFVAREPKPTVVTLEVTAPTTFYARCNDSSVGIRVTSGSKEAVGTERVGIELPLGTHTVSIYAKNNAEQIQSTREFIIAHPMMVSVDEWGDIPAQNLRLYHSQVTGDPEQRSVELISVPNYAPPKTVTNYTYMFFGADKFNQSILNGEWDIDHVVALNSTLNASGYNNPVRIVRATNRLSCNLLFNLSKMNSPIYIEGPISNIDQIVHKCSDFDAPITVKNTGDSAMSMRYGFAECPKLNSPIIIEGLVSNIDSFMRNNKLWNQPMYLNAYGVNGVAYAANAFNGCTNLRQDYSQWCVPHIPSKPSGFDTGVTNWPASMQPRWGTCPTPPTSE